MANDHKVAQTTYDSNTYCVTTQQYFEQPLLKAATSVC